MSKKKKVSVLAKAVEELDAALAQDAQEETTENTEENQEEAQNEEASTEEASGILKSITDLIAKAGKGKKAKVEEEDEDEQDEEDESDESEDDEEEAEVKKPAFFKKKFKKSFDHEDESDEEVVTDVTEFMSDFAESVDTLSKAVGQLQDGMAALGELVLKIDAKSTESEAAQATLSKAIAHLIKGQEKLSKAAGIQVDLKKSAAPARPAAPAPKAAGKKNENEEDLSKSQKTFSQDDKNRLFKAATSKQISIGEMNKAIAENDFTIFDRIK